MDSVSNGGRFQIGHQRGGRPKGSQNRDVLEVRRFCQDIVSGAEYRQRLADDLVARRVPAAVELMLWERAWGAIEKTVRIDDVQTLDTDDLLRRMRAIAAAMPETDVLPVEQLSGENETPVESHRPDDGNEPPA